MIREARKEDTEEMIELLKVILTDMELPMMHEVDWEDIKPALVEAGKHEAYRINYRNAVVKEVDGRLAGFFYGYEGGAASRSFEPIGTVLEKHDLPVFEIFSDEESVDGEWYLDSLVTHQDYRGQGVGKELLEAAFKKAKASGFSVIGLNVDHENPRAKALYERMGFKKTGEVVLADHDYDHMQKQL
ncbi:MAG: GNAT family N-acetyltransferase [Alkalibacterium sp.]